MNRTDLPTEIRRILDGVQYVTIATVCPDGRPWNTPVFGVFDDRLNLYWASWPGNQHSRNIAQNPRIFVVVYDSKAKEGEGLGIYIEMRARMLSSRRAVQSARKVYTTKFGESMQHDPFVGECPRRLFAARLLRIWQNSDDYIHGNFIDIRRELTVKVG